MKRSIYYLLYTNANRKENYISRLDEDTADGTIWSYFYYHKLNETSSS